MKLRTNNELSEMIETFNNKYEGKEVNWCYYNYIGNFINFNPVAVTFCCNSTTGKYPEVCGTSDEELKNLNKVKYIKSMLHIIDENQKNGPCKGCQLLKKMNFEHITEHEIKIKNIAWNFFRGCNSNCVYCGDDNKFETFYDPLDIVKRFVQEKFVVEKASIAWGGGEPTLLSNLEKYIDFASEKGWTQLLNTSGLICKESIINILERSSEFEVQISVDSGTRETYKKVKGQNGYDLVWKTIERYCMTGGKVYVKYIVFSYNSDISEIDEFIKKCIVSGVRNIVISGESASSWQLEGERLWTFGEKEEYAAAYLMDKCIENKVALFCSINNFSSENNRNILNIFIKTYLIDKILNKKICIWGMGMRGRKLADCLLEYNIEIECFGDSNDLKNGFSYKGILCRSLEELKISTVKNKYYIFVAIDDYKEMYDRLQTEIPNADVSVWNLY